MFKLLISIVGVCDLFSFWSFLSSVAFAATVLVLVLGQGSSSALHSCDCGECDGLAAPLPRHRHRYRHHHHRRCRAVPRSCRRHSCLLCFALLFACLLVVDGQERTNKSSIISQWTDNSRPFLFGTAILVLFWKPKPVVSCLTCFLCPAVCAFVLFVYFALDNSASKLFVCLFVLRCCCCCEGGGDVVSATTPNRFPFFRFPAPSLPLFLPACGLSHGGGGGDCLKFLPLC